ncbi:hypothetical protein ACA910_009654 [Epithemia clementina (nom. ined.)]
MAFLSIFGKKHESIVGDRPSRRRKQHEDKTRKFADGKKSRSLQLDDAKPVSGVFVSGRTLTTKGSHHPPSRCSFSSHSNDSICQSWKTSGDKGHNNNAPLIAQNPDDNDDDVITDAAQRLGMVMARSRKLPDTWYFSSNHILVNQERVQRTIAPLIRMTGLDEIARLHAEDMAQAGDVYYLDLEQLRRALENVNCHRLGVNVQRGTSIRDIHDVMMHAQSNKNNILDRRFTHMGMGTAVSHDGRLYLCQILRG